MEDDIIVEVLPIIDGDEYVILDKNEVVVTVIGQSAEEEKPAETAEAQAPEVISKGKKEEEGAAAAAEGAKK